MASDMGYEHFEEFYQHQQHQQPDYYCQQQQPHMDYYDVNQQDMIYNNNNNSLELYHSQDLSSSGSNPNQHLLMPLQAEHAQSDVANTSYESELVSPGEFQ